MSDPYGYNGSHVDENAFSDSGRAASPQAPTFDEYVQAFIEYAKAFKKGELKETELRGCIEASLNASLAQLSTSQATPTITCTSSSEAAARMPQAQGLEESKITEHTEPEISIPIAQTIARKIDPAQHSGTCEFRLKHYGVGNKDHCDCYVLKYVRLTLAAQPVSTVAPSPRCPKCSNNKISAHFGVNTPLADWAECKSCGHCGSVGEFFPSQPQAAPLPAAQEALTRIANFEDSISPRDDRFAMKTIAKAALHAEPQEGPAAQPLCAGCKEPLAGHAEIFKPATGERWHARCEHFTKGGGPALDVEADAREIAEELNALFKQHNFNLKWTDESIIEDFATILRRHLSGGSPK